MNNDRKTTLLGLILAALVAANIDWGLFFQGDVRQFGLLVGAVVTALFAWYTNKRDEEKDGGKEDGS